MNVLVAQRTYASGRGAHGSSTWKPSRPGVDALDAAFYAAFGAVEPAGMRMMLVLDVSGLMGMPVVGMPLPCRDVEIDTFVVYRDNENWHGKIHRLITDFARGGL